MWVDNLSLWREVQDYHMLFYSKFMDPYVVKKKAKVNCHVIASMCVGNLNGF